MPNYPYGSIGTPLDTNNLNEVNENWKRIAADISDTDNKSAIRTNQLTEEVNKQTVKINNLVNDIGEQAFNQVVASAVVNRNFSPVSTFSQLGIIYPDAQNGDAVQTLDDNKTYRYNGSEWVFIENFGVGPFTDVYKKLDEQNFMINVKSTGAVGDGVADDTNAFVEAVSLVTSNGGGTIYAPPGNYKCSSLSLSNLNGVKFIGEKAVMVHTNAGNLFGLIGVCNDVEITGFEYVGHFVLTTYDSAFIGSSSGQSISNLHVHHNYIHDTKLGISLNANEAGYVRDSLIEFNRVENIKGALSGNGYGIHVANHDLNMYANVKIRDNVIKSAERHSIYVARGRGYEVTRNLVLDHRKTINDTLARAAIALARSQDVKCEKNTVKDCYNIGIAISPDTETVGSVYTSRNIRIEKNDIFDCKLGGIWIHTPDAATQSEIDGVIVSENVIRQTNSPIISADSQGIRVYAGKNMTLNNNRIFLDRSVVTSLQHCIIYYATGETTAPSTPLYNENVVFKENDCRLNGGFGFGFRFSGGQNTKVKIKFLNNTSNTTNFFVAVGTVSNPNLVFVGHAIASMSYAAGVSPAFLQSYNFS